MATLELVQDIGEQCRIFFEMNEAPGNSVKREKVKKFKKFGTVLNLK